MSTTITGIVTNGVVVPSSPLPEGAHVEIQVKSGAVPDAAREKARAAAVDQYLALARSSSFRSAGPYPTRDELHERH